MRFPYPDEVSPGLRALARRIMPGAVRRAGVDLMWRGAQFTDSLDPAYRANSRSLARLRDTHAGETCVVIGNGPSLRHTDFSLLSDVPTFGLNRLYLLSRENGFVPTFHVAANDILIEQFASDLEGFASVLFLPWRHRARFSRRERLHFFPLRFDNRFSTDATAGIAVGGTVTMVALQLAFHMGFARVLLVGVDHRYTFGGAPNEELVSHDADPNHFSDKYFGAGIRWNAPDLKLSEESYAGAKNVFESRGRRIIDCTVGGELRIFPRSTLESELGH